MYNTYRFSHRDAIMSSFQERQKSLFNQLKDAEDQCSFSKSNKVVDPPNYGEVDRQQYRKLKREMKQFRGKESIFKRPEAKLRECLRAKTIPNHIKNPQKYVYYSLADVTPDQMSEATNTATAFALIKKLEEQEAAKTEMDHDADEFVFKKPIFQVSSTVKKAPPPSDDKVVFKSRKVVMPEYVVGMSKKKEKKPVRKELQDSVDIEKKADLKLNHLYDDDED